MAFSALCMTSNSPFPDLKNWNKAIKRQVQKGNLVEAFSLYVSMQERGFHPDSFTFPTLLEVAGRCNSLNNLGFVLHGQAIKTCFSNDLFVQTSLLNMYSNIKDIKAAHNVFDKMPVKDVIAWNSMLDAYASHEQMDVAATLFDLMPVRDLTSYNIMISGYAKARKLKLARSFFESAHRRDVASWNSMILACILTGHMGEAERLFNQVPNKNIVTWNTMVSGYLRNELYSKVLELFILMKADENVKLDHITVSGVLAACAHLASLEAGRAIHIYALEHHLMRLEVTTSLIDMYAKCGSIGHSLQVFYKSQAKDIFCWNAIMSGLALNGHGRAALKLFDTMRRAKSLSPDDITFIAVLTACSHSGLVEEGCALFSSMKEDHGIPPKSEHYGCMVDLLGRANLLSQALDLVESMPFKLGETILGALLSACVTHQNIEVGQKVVRLVIEKREQDMNDGEYMMVSNLYAACGEWGEAAKWRKKMNEEGIVKAAGCSVIELNGKSHRFLAGGLTA
uniref:Uncharacterized protein n=2 Tax=Opuntia streptacantha TaxID=393608 RepID=A0A7C9AJW0_OPUST